MLKTLGAAIGAALIAGAAPKPCAAGVISGAGATFPASVYNKWADDGGATQTSLNYQAIGSAAASLGDPSLHRRLRRERQAAEAGRPG